MPATYDLPRASELWNEQERNLYNKLPYYLANLNAKYFPIWNTWNKLMGKVQWSPNMGTTLRGVRAEPTPIGRQVFFPNAITGTPAKDRAEVREVTSDGLVYRHLFESPYMHFLPSFQDFRRDQVGFAMKDLAQQIAVANDQFIRTYVYYKSPKVLISGAATPVITAPTGYSSATAVDAKTTAFHLSCIQAVGSNKGNLSMKLLFNALNIMREDEQVPAWEGMVNTPKDNETIKGRYVIVGSNEAFSALTFDEHILQYKDTNMNLLNDEFKGVLFGSLVYKTERFPLRIAADGTIPVPQVWETNSGAANYGETVPNPAYVDAPFEVAFLMGAEPYRSINVGAPPKEFASGSMSEGKFSKLSWNGEVRITKDLLIDYGVTNGSRLYDTNKYGEFLQLISDVTHGAIAVNRRFVLPIIYRRVRAQVS